MVCVKCLDAMKSRFFVVSDILKASHTVSDAYILKSGDFCANNSAGQTDYFTPAAYAHVG